MLKPLSYLISLLCILSISAVDARKHNKSRLKLNPKMEAIWFTNGQGNKRTNDDEYQLSVGSTLYVVIQANKDAHGQSAIFDLEEAACTYQLINDDYQIKNGVVHGIILNGDSINPRKPSRRLNNLTRLGFIAIEETQ